MELGPIVYKILFNDSIEPLPDPNKPANVPRISAMQRAEAEKFKQFWEGPGSPLMDRWQNKIRTNIFDLLVSEHDCNCKTCNKIREITTIIKLLSEAQLILKTE